MTSPLPHSLVEPLLRRALEEDLAHGGDLTSLATIPEESQGTAQLNAREPGITAGIGVAAQVFTLIDPACAVTAHQNDGEPFDAGSALLTIKGPTRSLLMAERTALNLLSHLTAIAMETAAYVDLINGTKASIAATRKTLPGLRVLQKHAVRCGGGMTHRMSLSDAVMIKDNHIVGAGSLKDAVERARGFAGHTVKIEVEVDTLDQLQELLPLKPDIVLLDNMTTDELREAVVLSKGECILEASGGITRKTARAIAETGVDILSIGALTHSVKALDIGMELNRAH